jgi:hypothetical protein
MPLNNNTPVEIGSALFACPSCNSDNWKSARMVVLEGTSYTKGDISGDITDPGTFSGGLKEFLLSDRWFSWDYKLEAEFVSTTKSGLVEVVKQFMVDNSSMILMPSIPIEPKKIGFFERIRPIEPNPPKEPQKPKMPVAKPWYIHFLLYTVGQTFLCLLVGFFVKAFGFKVRFSELLIIFAFIIFISLIRSFWGNKRARKNYEEEVLSYQNLIEKYKTKIEKYNYDVQSYMSQCQEAKLQQEKEEQSIAIYKKELSKYEFEKNNVMGARELLWENARVCTRCGKAYLGVKV